MLLSALPSSVLAGNAYYTTGNGAESSLMAGADTAVARDTFAVVNNPAGLSQIDGQQADISSSVFYAEGSSHSDANGNYRVQTKTAVGGYGDIGYAKHLSDTPFTLGAVLIVQGGLGWTYKNLNTVYGTRDETSSLASLIKLAPGVSWKINDQLSLGTNLGLTYSSSSQTLFPNTSAPPFFGINFKDASGYGFSAKLGMQYRPLEDVVIGLTYATKTHIPLKGGSLRANYSNFGAPGTYSIVRYDDAQVKGFALPQEIAMGISFRPFKPLLISMQNKWYDWSESSKSVTLIARNPRGPVPAGLEQIVATTQIGALDQHVYSIGVAYDYDEKTIIYAGANYGRRNIPEQNLAPSFQLMQQLDYALGMRRIIDDEWSVTVGIERLPQQQVTYNNPATPFGTSVANHSGTVLDLQASRRW